MITVMFTTLGASCYHLRFIDEEIEAPRKSLQWMVDFSC